MAHPVPRITLYGRPGCHLCEQVEATLGPLQRTLGFTLDVVNIEAEAALLERYFLEIPVIALGGSVIARAPIDRRALPGLLRSALARD
ncbi:MAG: glutaredoxin family protein [Dehalococcoidia bacterium]